jgi:hypothetical protein
VQTYECSKERQDSANYISTTLGHIIAQLVDNPNEVKIDIKHGEQTTVFQVSVAKADLGKVIGKQGKTANALRNIMICMSARLKLRCVLIMVE